MDIAPGSSPGPQLNHPELAADSRGDGVDAPESEPRLGTGIPSGAPPSAIAAWPPASWGPNIHQIGD